MGFTDALIDDADVRVALVDRRSASGGHWRDAYPFVRLHQASLFYGVASARLGGGRVQTEGPEAGLHERADQSTICGYYDEVLARMLKTDRVEFFPGCDYLGGRTFVSLASGELFEAPQRCRVVDARYISPEIPARTPPKFAVDAGARVVPVNDLARVEDAPSQYVVVGAGKTATDAVVWLLGRGVDPDEICWVRPRDPWMLNRARVQPDPAVFLGMVADVMREAAAAHSLTDLFLRLEEVGVMLRIDRSVSPSMAKTPTLATWELDLLRTVEDVVRLGHVETVRRGSLELSDGTVAVKDDALVVNCTADGLKTLPLVPIWQREAITLQSTRAGFPCFGAAVIGYIEASGRNDAEKNQLCPPSTYGNSLAQWARMNVQGARSAAAFRSDPDIRAWSDELALNPARIPAGAGSPRLDDALAQVQLHSPPGLARLTQLSAAAAG